MKYFILSDLECINSSLKRYLKEIIGISDFGDTIFDRNEFSDEILDYDLYFIKGFKDNYMCNPEGWRTAKKLGALNSNDSKIRKFFIFFIMVPEYFPEEGSFWLTLFRGKSIKEKFEEISGNPPPKKEDFEKAEEMWPRLKYKPKGHHHG